MSKNWFRFIFSEQFCAIVGICLGFIWHILLSSRLSLRWIYGIISVAVCIALVPILNPAQTLVAWLTTTPKDLIIRFVLLIIIVSAIAIGFRRIKSKN